MPLFLENAISSRLFPLQRQGTLSSLSHFEAGSLPFDPANRLERVENRRSWRCFVTHPCLILLAGALSVGLNGANPAQPERKPAKEPVYQSRTPLYAQLAFGPEGKERVWLVLDGDTLYVDRKGDGDLTDPSNKVAAEKRPNRDAEEGHKFEPGELSVGGRKHKGLTLFFSPLKLYTATSIGKRADVKAALVRNPNALVASLQVKVDMPDIKGGAGDGRVLFMVGPVDLEGPLLFADRAAAAPVIKLGGPLQVTFYAEKPTLRVGRGTELDLVVGTPGDGPGTFAMLGYQDTIPVDARPFAELLVPSAQANEAPVREKFELKERC